LKAWYQLLHLGTVLERCTLKEKDLILETYVKYEFDDWNRGLVTQESQEGGAEPGLGVKKRSPPRDCFKLKPPLAEYPECIVLFVDSQTPRRSQLHYLLYFFLAYSVCFPNDFSRENYRRRSGWKELTSIVTSRELNIMGRILLVSDNAVGEAVKDTA
jgi:hypothetical protein